MTTLKKKKNNHVCSTDVAARVHQTRKTPEGVPGFRVFSLFDFFHFFVLNCCAISCDIS